MYSSDTTGTYVAPPPGESDFSSNDAKITSCEDFALVGINIVLIGCISSRMMMLSMIQLWFSTHDVPCSAMKNERKNKQITGKEKLSKKIIIGKEKSSTKVTATKKKKDILIINIHLRFKTF